MAILVIAKSHKKTQQAIFIYVYGKFSDFSTPSGLSTLLGPSRRVTLASLWFWLNVKPDQAPVDISINLNMILFTFYIKIRQEGFDIERNDAPAGRFNLMLSRFES